MIIGFVENGEIQIYDNIDHAMSEWGRYPSDIMSDVIIFFEEDGAWLKPIPNYAPRTWYRWFNKLISVNFKRSIKNDNYQDSINYLINHETIKLAENKYFSSLKELKGRYPDNE